jgi:hypothetical protein
VSCRPYIRTRYCHVCRLSGGSRRHGRSKLKTSLWPFRRYTQTTGCIPSDGWTGFWMYNSTVIKRYSCQPYSFANYSNKILRHHKGSGLKKTFRTARYKGNLVGLAAPPALAAASVPSAVSLRQVLAWDEPEIDCSGIHFRSQISYRQRKRCA